MTDCACGVVSISGNRVVFVRYEPDYSDREIRLLDIKSGRISTILHHAVGSLSEAAASSWVSNTYDQEFPVRARIRTLLLPPDQ